MLKKMIVLFREYVEKGEAGGGAEDVELNLIFARHLMNEIEALCPHTTIDMGECVTCGKRIEQPKA